MMRYENEPETGNRSDELTANFGNDYSNLFAKRNIFPQSSVTNIDNPFQGYPRLEKLHVLKQEHHDFNSSPPVCLRVPESKIRDTVFQMYKQDVKFDVIMVNGCTESFSVGILESLCIPKISARPGLLFLWVPSNKISEGRKVMEEWGYRHGEDITYHASSDSSPHCPDRYSWQRQNSILRPTTWHCLMGLRGTLRRSTDTHLINCNIDTDVIIERKQQNTAIPDEAYQLIENFTNMGRKIHILPTALPENLCVKPRKGWVIVSPDAFSVGKFNPSTYTSRKLIPVNVEIDILRPKTPPSH